MLEIRPLRPEEYPAYTSMTFPEYRPLLVADNTSCKVLAAWVHQIAVGLIVFQTEEFPKINKSVTTLRSVYVIALYRKTGIATALMQAGEKYLKEAGVEEVTGQYQQEYKERIAIEKLLAKTGWEDKPHRLLAYSSYSSAILEDGVFQRMGVPSGFEIFMWKDMTAEEEEKLKAKYEDPQFKEIYIPHFNPFLTDKSLYLPYNSVGLRHKGEIVGWVLTIKHHLPNMTHIANMFAIPEFARKGYAMVLAYQCMTLEREFLRPNHTQHTAMWQSFYDNPGMIRNIEKRLAKYCHTVVHYNMAKKAL